MFDLVNILKYHILNLLVHFQGVWVYIVLQPNTFWCVDVLIFRMFEK